MLSNLEVFKAYKKSPYLSLKHSTYFQVYEELLTQYKNTAFTFVEVGILNGGSLFMWREFFGNKARIIGIDLNPLAKKWEKDGFEIFIGSQSSPQFWDQFFKEVGMIDVLLDDGGHTEEQQIITTSHCIPFINDGGMLIIEDVQTSYLKAAGNPSKYSFISYAKNIVDAINSRNPQVNISENSLKKRIYSATFYDSIVAFKINAAKCFVGQPTSNDGLSMEAWDYWREDALPQKINQFIERQFKRFGIRVRMNNLTARIENKLRKSKIKKYFY
ncbi:class I SAM-dependent methyltransferase [Polynucleobacter paneuropaeus]|nr:class I SAM-dependent methyltransferase [Polynucleobacter paneuropaeus]